MCVSRCEGLRGVAVKAYREANDTINNHEKRETGVGEDCGGV